MAKIRGPLLSTRASGRFGGVLSFRDTARGPVATRYHYPGSRNLVTPSQAQLDHRALYGALVASWRALTQPQRDQYNADSLLLGLSGWALYVQQNISAPPPVINPSVANVGTRLTGENINQLSGSFALPSLTSPVLIVIAGEEGSSFGGDQIVSGITYNGVAMTRAHFLDIGGGGSNYNRIEIWFLLKASLPSPGDYPIVVTWSSSVSAIYAIPLVLQNANQGTPNAVGGNTSNASPLTANITPAVAGSIIIESFVVGNLGTFTPNSGQSIHDQFSGYAITASMGVGSKADVQAQLYAEQWSHDTVNRFVLALASWGPA